MAQDRTAQSDALTRRGVIALGLTAFGAAAGSVSAQSPGSPPPASGGGVRSVVELFTSQGCSSCPRADILLESYAQRPDVLALSFSVDYWDYLGWKDTLANPKFTKRQRQYSTARGDGQVYTPQAVVNGTAHVVGSDRRAIDGALAKTAVATQKGWVPIGFKVEPKHFIVNCGAVAAGGAPKDATLWLAQITRKVTVAIPRGENAGRTMTYHNVVRDFAAVGMWSGEAMTVKLDRQAIQQAEAELYAVVLQQGHAGPIVGAALLPAA